jgi:hypothetical protein
MGISDPCANCQKYSYSGVPPTRSFPPPLTVAVAVSHRAMAELARIESQELDLENEEQRLLRRIARLEREYQETHLARLEAERRIEELQSPQHHHVRFFVLPWRDETDHDGRLKLISVHGAKRMVLPLSRSRSRSDWISSRRRKSLTSAGLRYSTACVWATTSSRLSSVRCFTNIGRTIKCELSHSRPQSISQLT